MEPLVDCRQPSERVLIERPWELKTNPAKVEVAVAFNLLTDTPPVKVEVALPLTVRVVPTFKAPVVVELVVVELRAVKLPTVVEPVEKRLTAVN